jgi:hypothetical protein
MRYPKISDLTTNDMFGLGPAIASIFQAAGITDEDLPDIVPDDLDYDDKDAVAKHFPGVVAKITALCGETS